MTLLLAALLGLSASLGAHLRKRNVELSGEIERRLKCAVEAAHRCPDIRHIAVETAGITMNVIIVNMHGRVGIVVFRIHAVSLASAVCLQNPIDCNPLTENLEDTHAVALRNSRPAPSGIATRWRRLLAVSAFGRKMTRS